MGNILLFGNYGPSSENKSDMQYIIYLYLLIHQEPVSAFEEEKNKEIRNLFLILLSLYRSFYFWPCLFYCFNFTQ